MSADNTTVMGEHHRSDAASRRAPARRIAAGVRRLARNDGQAIVEFALVIPMFLLLVFGIINFGQAYNYKNEVTSLANQAARYAEVNSCAACGTGTNAIATYVESTAEPNLANGGGQITTPLSISFCFPSGSTGQLGQALQVTASATYSWLPFLQAAMRNATSSSLASSVTVRVAVAYVAGTSPYTASSC
jgi:hypothetical protein